MLWVVAEGLDGCGKSTLCENVARILPGLFPEGRAPEIIRTREPGGRDVPEVIREEALHPGWDRYTRQLLMGLDARVNFLRNIAPNAGRDVIVLQDRGAPSASVYSGLEDPLVESFGHAGQKPDAYIWVQCDPIIASARVRQRGASNHFDRADITELQKRESAYREYFRKERDVVPTLMVDTNRPHNSPELHARTTSWWLLDLYRESHRG